MPSINLTNFENVVAHTISEINDTGIQDIKTIYASQTDIIDLLNNKADQVDTYTKAQIDSNFYTKIESYNKTEVDVLSNNISSNTFLIGNLSITSNTNFNNISSNTNLISNLNSTMSTNFNNISSNSNLINTNINNISSNTHLIDK